MIEQFPGRGVPDRAGMGEAAAVDDLVVEVRYEAGRLRRVTAVIGAHQLQQVHHIAAVQLAGLRRQLAGYVRAADQQCTADLDFPACLGSLDIAACSDVSPELTPLDCERQFKPFFNLNGHAPPVDN